jgi:hypothetical protein
VFLIETSTILIVSVVVQNYKTELKTTRNKLKSLCYITIS